MRSLRWCKEYFQKLFNCAFFTIFVCVFLSFIPSTTLVCQDRKLMFLCTSVGEKRCKACVLSIFCYPFYPFMLFRFYVTFYLPADLPACLSLDRRGWKESHFIRFIAFYPYAFRPSFLCTSEGEKRTFISAVYAISTFCVSSIPRERSVFKSLLIFFVFYFSLHHRAMLETKHSGIQWTFVRYIMVVITQYSSVQ